MSDIRTKIISNCFDKNGFLVLLHSHKTFDDILYRRLVDQISEYISTLGDSKQVDRAIAGCIFEIWSQLWVALEEFQGHPDLKKVESAQEEIDKLWQAAFWFPEIHDLK